MGRDKERGICLAAIMTCEAAESEGNAEKQSRGVGGIKKKLPFR